MSFTLPNPSSPTNGQLGDATPILQNELALAQAIANFDGSQISSKSVTEAALADAINPRLRGSETLANFVFSGCTWSALAGNNGTMTGGTIYVNGYRTVVTGVGSNTFTLSSDTYVDIDNLGNVTYVTVANGASSPSLTANSLRVAKIVTSGSAITTITQTGWDGLGNPIYNTSPRPILIGYAQITGNLTTQSTTAIQATGLTATVIIPPGAKGIGWRSRVWYANTRYYTFSYG
jgi:hypothetical protein